MTRAKKSVSETPISNSTDIDAKEQKRLALLQRRRELAAIKRQAVKEAKLAATDNNVVVVETPASQPQSSSLTWTHAAGKGKCWKCSDPSQWHPLIVKLIPYLECATEFVNTRKEHNDNIDIIDDQGAVEIEVDGTPIVIHVNSSRATWLNEKSKNALTISGTKYGTLTGDYDYFLNPDHVIQDLANQILYSRTLSTRTGREDTASSFERAMSSAELVRRGRFLNSGSVGDELLKGKVLDSEERMIYHTSRGIKHEDTAAQAFCDQTGHTVIKIPPFTVFRNSKLHDGHVNGTPDFITHCGQVIEIKCPEKKSSAVKLSYQSQLKLYMGILNLNYGMLVKYYTSDKTIAITNYYLESYVIEDAEDYDEDDIIREACVGNNPFFTQRHKNLMVSIEKIQNAIDLATTPISKMETLCIQ